MKRWTDLGHSVPRVLIWMEVLDCPQTDFYWTDAHLQETQWYLISLSPETNPFKTIFSSIHQKHFQ